ncbi:MAG: class I SAM-dependent methyltransferase [Planctomycetaceae bacterium]|nr:class I SAM-dependent methyltransferase [Planctomycetaceae bacterium]
MNTTSINQSSINTADQPGWLIQGVLRHLLQLQDGELLLNLPGGSSQRVGAPAEDALQAQVHVHNQECFRKIALNGSLGAAEAYLNGDWTTDDLVSVLRIFCRNLDQLSQMERGLAALLTTAARWWHNRRRNTVDGSQRNIAEHYDLSNEFFQLFLDPTLMYSAALFERPEMTLQQASVAKLDRICQRLDVRPGDHIIEIGTGWGGWALHAAQNYGCRITTTTISRNQYELAQQRIAAAGLTDRVTVLLKDYRHLTGTFDKLVSIEMIEAVGHEFLPQYFQACHNLLKPGGRMVIQAITMPDHRYEVYRRSVDFIQRYIFPGGHLPSVRAMQQATEQGTWLQLVEAVQFPDSYALTLRHWRNAFHERLDEVRALGFDERFIRMWDYYLCYCEAAFLERAVHVGQFVWERNRYC